MLPDFVKTYIENHKEEARELLLALAKIPAPSHHEEKRAEFCMEWLRKQGAEGVYMDEALNVVYPVRDVDEEGRPRPVAVFMAHMDVVFPDREELPLTIEDGKIFCPGVGDDTANLAGLLFAAKYVAETKADPKDLGVVFVCNSCEEGLGNLKGSRKICETYGNRIKAFYTVDGYMSSYTNRSVGSYRYRLSVKTEGGHSYWAFGKDNAIAKLSEIICDLYRIPVPEKGKTTYNVGTIKGGTSVNTIAQNAAVTYEFRSDCEESIKKMENLFQQLVAEHRQRGTELSVEVIGIRPCEGKVKEEARKELFDRVIRAVADASGKVPVGQSGSTDCNIPLSMGIPSVCFGVCEGAGFHTREEFIYENSLVPGYQVVFEMVLHYFL